MNDSENNNSTNAQNENETENSYHSPDHQSMSEQEMAQALKNFDSEFGEDLKGLDNGFSDQLDEILGDNARVALMVTPIQKVDLLAAFCVMADIDALCVSASQGCVAVLKNCKADQPQQAAQNLTKMVEGMSVALAVNRANKLDVRWWLNGQEGEQIVPPVLFMSTAGFVEDLLVGEISVEDISKLGYEAINTDTLNHDKALQIMHRYMTDNPGNDAE